MLFLMYCGRQSEKHPTQATHGNDRKRRHEPCNQASYVLPPSHDLTTAADHGCERERESESVHQLQNADPGQHLC